MCLILDANRYGDFLNPDNQDMEPVRKWLNKKGKLVYSPTPKFERELIGKIQQLFQAYRKAGKLKMIDKGAVQNALKELKESKELPKLRSNDPHIIALAQVARVRLLVSSDKKLHDDFQDRIQKGKIYQTKDHKNLLTNDRCP